MAVAAAGHHSYCEPRVTVVELAAHTRGLMELVGTVMFSGEL